MYAPWHRKAQRPPRPRAHQPPPPNAPVTTPHQQHAADATRTTDAPAPSLAGTPESPRQERASKRLAQRHPPQHHMATGIHRDRASPAGSRTVPSPTNTGAVDTQPEEPHGGAHPYPDPTPRPQTPPGASTHGHQPAASRAAATQAHLECHPRHGTPDRPTAGPANTPPEDPPTQTRAATPTDTTTTRPSDTVHPQAHDPTESRSPQVPATSGTTARGDLPATAQAEAASQWYHAPPAGPAVRPTEPSSPGCPAPTRSWVQTWLATPSRRTPRGPRTREADPGRRLCRKATPERLRDHWTMQPRRPHRKPNHKARSPHRARRTCRDPHNGQQHNHQWGNLAGEWTSQQYSMPTQRAWQDTEAARA